MRLLIAALLGVSLTPALRGGEPFALPADNGYRGIWYAVGPTKDEYGYKYSGGMATYPHQQLPMACYAAAVEKMRAEGAAALVLTGGNISMPRLKRILGA